LVKKEHKGIPLLTCVNEKGFVKEVDDTKLVLDLDGNTIPECAQIQLSNRPIIIIPDEINLTRRAVEQMDRFHKLAADIMLSPEFCPSIQNESRC
jgi:hypothetical protein